MMTTTNLLQDAKIATKKNKKFLIISTISNCPYCTLLKEEVINPMSKLVEYNYLIIREISSSYDSFIDFDGKHITGQEFNSFYKIDFYPTVIIMNNTGKTLEKIVGISNIEYYWYELDKLLEKYS